VKQEAKLPYLLECLQKTAPPVLIFAENKARTGYRAVPLFAARQQWTDSMGCTCPLWQRWTFKVTPCYWVQVLWSASRLTWHPDTAGQADVDDIHERLLTVAVEAVSIHGGKDQEEREAAIQHFKAGTKVRPPPGPRGRGAACDPPCSCCALRCVQYTVSSVAAMCGCCLLGGATGA
jgi:hypothetical protein